MLEILLAIYLNITELKVSPQETNFFTVAKPINDSKPFLNSDAAIIYNQNTNQILFQSNQEEKLPIASLTKLMTAHIILQEHSLEEIVTIPREALNPKGSTMNLQAGERITVENLLKGLMINSANDAAIALSLHNAKTLEDFSDKMNLYANNLQMKNSHFDNPMGFDSPKNYSTALDILKLSRVTAQNPFLQEVSNIKSTKVKSSNNLTTHLLTNTNKELQNFQNINGLKTGTTQEAGQCLVSTTEEDKLITIVLGSTNRFQDTKTMIDWARNNFK